MTQCNESVFRNLFTQSNVLNQYGLWLVFMGTTSFPKQVCPFVFKNLRLYTLKLMNNGFEFDSTIYSNMEELNSTVTELQITQMNDLNLKIKLLYLYVFSKILFLSLEGSVRTIELDVFKSFTNLRLLNMQLRNLKGLFHSLAIEWIDYLNYGRQELDFNNQSYYANDSLTNDAISILNQNFFGFTFSLTDFKSEKIFPLEYFMEYHMEYWNTIFKVSISRRGLLCLFKISFHENYFDFYHGRIGYLRLHGSVASEVTTFPFG
jgi:hypothetical protein